MYNAMSELSDRKNWKENIIMNIRYHDLRHLNASMLLKVLPVTDVSEHLGHSTTNTTTRVYAHSLLKRKSEVAEGLDNIFVAS